MSKPETTMGTQVGRYTLIAEIGRGGMADVFLAISGETTGFNRLFVIKRPHMEIMERPELVRMFLHEAKVAARLNHRNIVQVYDALEAGEAGERPLIVMEFLDGQPFSRLFSKRKGAPEVPLELQIEVLREVLNGLQYIHEFRDLDGSHFELVHRDVSPQNIFLTYDGQVKLLDFGITKRLNAGDETQAGFIKGKIRYMAPEQARNEAVDRRTDIFSIGMILGQILTGASLWGDTQEMQVLTRLVADQGPPPPSAPEHPELVAICARATHPDPAARYQSAEAMRGELDAWIQGRARFGPGELGGWLSKIFARSRERLKETLSEYTEQAKSEGPRHGDLPRLRLNTSITTQPSGSSWTNHEVPHVDTSGLSSMQPAPAAPSPMRWIVLALAAMALGGGAALYALRPAPTPAPAPAIQAAKAPTHHPLTVQAKPAEARILLNGRLLSVGKFEGSVLKVGEAYTLRLEAEGYAPLEMRVEGSGPQRLTLMLSALPDVAQVKPVDAGVKENKKPRHRPKKGKPPRAPKEKPVKATPKTPKPLGGAAGKKPKRGIDTTSPY